MHSQTKTPYIAEVLADATEVLTAQGIANARLDAEVLLAHTLSMTRTTLLTRLRDFLPAEAHSRFQHLLNRRQQREPLQYITGVQEFWSLAFHVTPDVLIPRPETELLVEVGLRVGREEKSLASQSPIRPTPTSHFPPLKILDIGTGSGCIAIALATELPQAEIWATDISPAALVIAQENATLHNVAERIHFLQGELFSPVRHLNCIFDLIVSNPPYIAQSDIANLQPEVREWEPHHALDGGTDGLNFYRRLVQESPRYLRACGWLVMEIGYQQGADVLHLARQQLDLTNSICLLDYEGRDRVVLAQKKPEPLGEK